MYYSVSGIAVCLRHCIKRTKSKPPSRVWAWRPPWSDPSTSHQPDPSTSPLGCGPGDPPGQTHQPPPGCGPGDPPSQTPQPLPWVWAWRPSPVDRILDTRFWKYYLAPTSLLAVKMDVSLKSGFCCLMYKLGWSMNNFWLIHWRIQGGAPGTRAPPGGPNSFIFMQFSAKIINKHTHFGSWRPPPGKILDPPL